MKQYKSLKALSILVREKERKGGNLHEKEELRRRLSSLRLPSGLDALPGAVLHLEFSGGRSSWKYGRERLSTAVLNTLRMSFTMYDVYLATRTETHFYFILFGKDGQEVTLQPARVQEAVLANLGLSLDLAGLKGLAEQLLFNRELPLSLPYSKSSYQMDSGAGDWEILQTSIGQGQTLISPMHNLLIMSAIANDGVLMRPYLIDRVENASGELVKEFRPSEAAELMVPNEAAALQELLIQVVNEGTGSALKRDTYQAAGKTGSAEFETGKETHAWFVGYAPAEDPKIAVCVIVEEGGSGGGTAAPIAAELMDAWLLGE